MSKSVTVLLGTHKGAFLVKSDAGRSRWSIEGPYMKGSPVEYVVADTRNGLDLYASVTSPFYGPKVHRSRDGGASWDPIGSPKFDDGKRSVERVWVIEPAGRDQPGRLYAGVDPATLFTSPDGGENWEEVRGLSQHPTREKWQPGKGGMALHTVVQTDQQHLWVAISAAGVFYTEDGGTTWSVRTNGVRAEFMPDPHPAVGQCVHKIAMHPRRPNVLFLQNHGGVYRTDDGGQNWHTIEDGLPKVFGFPIVVHPHEPETVYIFPLVADAERYSPEGRPAVYRSRDSGTTWEPLRTGLPTDNAWFNVLRQAMCTDDLDVAGLYFGTTTGHLFVSADSGDHWQVAAQYLPPIYSVRTVCC